MNEVPVGTVGRLAVRGRRGAIIWMMSAGCLCPGWLEPDRGCVFIDENGYYHFAARNDDMIVSSGYNIAGPEVEAALFNIRRC